MIIHIVHFLAFLFSSMVYSQTSCLNTPASEERGNGEDNNCLITGIFDQHNVENLVMHIVHSRLSCVSFASSGSPCLWHCHCVVLAACCNRQCKHCVIIGSKPHPNIHVTYSLTQHFQHNLSLCIHIYIANQYRLEHPLFIFNHIYSLHQVPQNLGISRNCLYI